MKHAMILLSILLCSAWVYAEAQDQIPNLQQARYEIYSAGQPTNSGFERIAAMGVKTVINVLPEKECLKDEAKAVTSQNMVYKAVPFDLKDFRLDTVEQFAKLLKSEQKPILIHCSTGNHVGGLWFAYRVLVERAPLGIALKEARKIGMTTELENALFPWVIQQSTLTS